MDTKNRGVCLSCKVASTIRFFSFSQQLLMVRFASIDMVG